MFWARLGKPECLGEYLRLPILAGMAGQSHAQRRYRRPRVCVGGYGGITEIPLSGLCPAEMEQGSGKVLARTDTCWFHQYRLAPDVEVRFLKQMGG